MFLFVAMVVAACSVSAVQLQSVVTGLSSPVFVTSAKDGTNRLFIVERGGKIKVLQPGSSTPTIFLDVASKIVAGGEQGLLGLAFHPQYAVNRRFFVNYTRNSDGATMIAEYNASAANPNIADTTETQILTIAQPFSNHNGGMLEFGQDGFLYIGMGDGGSGNDPGKRAQNINELLGKILRIDIDHPNGSIPYSSPADNPFFGSIPGLDEIYAIGMRNPWRFSFDSESWQLYVGDVGQDLHEEADIVTLGSNQGWRIYEGNSCTNLEPSLCVPANYTAPIFDYAHSGGRCSIIGGYVYRGLRSAFIVGQYIYADYCTGEIFSWNGSTQSLVLDNAFRITSFGEDEAGEMYLTDITDSTVFRLVATPAPPECIFLISPSSQEFSPLGGAGSINVTAASDCKWRAASHVDWITLTSSNAGSGNSTLNFSVASNSSGTPRTGTITLGGNTFTVTQDIPEISIDDANVVEGNSGTTTATFTVSLSGASPSDVTVHYQTSNGTAASPSDYTSLNNNLTIPAGNLQGTIVVTVQSDSSYEQDETFFVDLSGPVNATMSDNQGLGTIQNDDSVPSLTINDVTITEGSSGTVNAIFTVSLSQISGFQTSVNYTTNPTTAAEGFDYVDSTGTLIVPAGNPSGTITVVVKGDVLFESMESYSVNLSVPVNATIADSKGKGFINNQKPTISITDVSQNEGNSGTANFEFTVNLSFAYTNGSVSLQYATGGGNATAPGDYTSASGTLTLPQNTASGTIPVSVNGDSLNEPNETLNVNLSMAVGASFADTKGVGTILNDDGLPSITINDVSLLEGNSGTTAFVFTIQLSAAGGAVIKVTYATGSGTASGGVGDFVGIPATTLSIPIGSTSATVTVQVNGDVAVEAAETFLLKLSNPKNATLADTQGLGTILNDD